MEVAAEGIRMVVLVPPGAREGDTFDAVPITGNLNGAPPLHPAPAPSPSPRVDMMPQTLVVCGFVPGFPTFKNSEPLSGEDKLA